MVFIKKTHTRLLGLLLQKQKHGGSLHVMCITRRTPPPAHVTRMKTPLPRTINKATTITTNIALAHNRCSNKKKAAIKPCHHLCSLTRLIVLGPGFPLAFLSLPAASPSSLLYLFPASVIILSASAIISLPTLHPLSTTPCSARTCSACAQRCRQSTSFLVPYCSAPGPPSVLPVLVRLIPWRGAAVENG